MTLAAFSNSILSQSGFMDEWRASVLVFFCTCILRGRLTLWCGYWYGGFLLPSFSTHGPPHPSQPPHVQVHAPTHTEHTRTGGRTSTLKTMWLFDEEGRSFSPVLLICQQSKEQTVLTNLFSRVKIGLTPKFGCTIHFWWHHMIFGSLKNPVTIYLQCKK